MTEPQKDKKGRAIIIGAGPAGLTAAFELLKHTQIHPVIYEMTNHIGGICQTVYCNGNRIDIGGHRFFSKSDRIMKWWQDIFPIEKLAEGQKIEIPLTYQGKTKNLVIDDQGPDPALTDKVLLVRDRKSRIYFLRKYFDYPLLLSFRTLSKLGLKRTLRILFSYLKSRLFPIRPEKTLRDFIMNRFGKELYLTFFRSYTEKVWGVPCDRIPAKWGAQRIKGVSLTEVLLNQLKAIIAKDPTILQKDVESSLIQKFLYPKFGPGQLWEEVAALIKQKGGEVHMNWKVIGIQTEGDRITAIEVQNQVTRQVKIEYADYVFSTMPVKDFIAGFRSGIPEDVKTVARGLVYRDFLTVGLLLKGFKKSPDRASKFPDDNWIYIQERDVLVGRIQIFNNWSPYMVADPEKAWIGMEYFCDMGDELWSKNDDQVCLLAIRELMKLDMIESENDVLDMHVVRMPKAYPAYFGSYGNFDVIRQFTDSFRNLFLVGRNGMHRYNNQDHSMLAAMTAVENIVNGVTGKDNLWDVNTDEVYQEM